jgi:hypothetical protein
LLRSPAGCAARAVDVTLAVPLGGERGLKLAFPDCGVVDRELPRFSPFGYWR